MCPGNVSARAGPQAVSRRLRAAQPPPRRRTLRRESQPALQAPAAAGDPEAVARTTSSISTWAASKPSASISRKHDIKFEEDNWEAPTLGAWGIGWQVMLDGLEITQFTYFQQCGGIDLDLVPAELTYGLERSDRVPPGRDSVYDIEWAPGVTYADVRLADEVQFSVYNFEMADVARFGSCSSCMRPNAASCWRVYENYPTRSASRCWRPMTRC